VFSIVFVTFFEFADKYLSILINLLVVLHLQTAFAASCVLTGNSVDSDKTEVYFEDTEIAKVLLEIIYNEKTSMLCLIMILFCEDLDFCRGQIMIS